MVRAKNMVILLEPIMFIVNSVTLGLLLTEKMGGYPDEEDITCWYWLAGEAAGLTTLWLSG
jgi:hypothetical protein